MTSSKILFALNGPSQSGKTSSIKLFLNFLQKANGERVFRSKKWIECLEVHEIEGRKIGITSRSDKFPILKSNFDFLLNEMACTVVVCAINEKTKGVTDFLAALKTAGWEIELIEKYPEFCNRAQRDQYLALNLGAARKIWEVFSSRIAINTMEDHEPAGLQENNWTDNSLD